MKRYLIKVIIFLLTSPLFAQSQIKLTTSNLYLREDPWIGDNIVCVIPKASSLAVDYSKQEYTDWIKITYNEHVGYVYSKYLTNLQVKHTFLKWHFSNQILYELTRSQSTITLFL